MVENIDLIVIPEDTPARRGNFIDELNFERALSPWNAEFVGRTIKFPDGSTERIREIHFETESDMEMFILRWVK